MASIKKKEKKSNDLRELDIRRHLDDCSTREIAQEVFIRRTSVHHVIAKCNSAKCVGNTVGRSRKRKTTANVDRYIGRRIMASRRTSSS